MTDRKDSDSMDGYSWVYPRVTCGVVGGRKEKLTCLLDSLACFKVARNSSASKPIT